MFTSIDIETTEICNRRCSYCPNSTHYHTRREGGPRQLPPATLKRIISQLVELDYCGRVDLNLYGEPLGDSRIISTAAVISETLPGAQIVIYTNGDRLDIEMAGNLDAIRNLSVIITDHSEYEPNDLRMLAAAHGFKYRKFSSETGVLHNRCGLVDHPLAKGRAKVCFPKASPNMYINARGEAQLCCNDYLAEVTYGNVLDRSLMEIWNDPVYAGHRAALPTPGLDICRRCNCNA